MINNFVKSAGRVKYFLILITAFLLFILAIYGITFNGNEYSKGVKIEGVDVSGLNRSEAGKLLAEAINKKYDGDTFSLSFADKTWRFGLNEISYEFFIEEALTKAFYSGKTGTVFKKALDSVMLALNGTNVEIRNEFDKNRLKEILKKIKAETDKASHNASITYNKGNIEIIDEINGRLLDIDNNANLVENQLVKRNFDNINLQVDDIKPSITYEKVKEIKSVISEFYTRFSLKDENRAYNIRLACSKIDGKIIMPGEIFSMNEVLGPRTFKNGYREAPVIFKNELIKGPGGGVCQVTTTLYNTVLLAKLGVIERSSHSIPLGYVRPGQDATIAGSSIDFKFTNNKDYPVCISAEVNGGKISIRILGKSEPVKKIVRLRSVVLDSITPEPDEIVIDDSIADGEKVVVKKPKNGIKAALYRETYSEENVLLEKELISNDYYKPVRGQVKINSNYMVFLTLEGYQ